MSAPAPGTTEHRAPLRLTPAGRRAVRAVLVLLAAALVAGAFVVVRVTGLPDALAGGPAGCTLSLPDGGSTALDPDRARRVTDAALAAWPGRGDARAAAGSDAEAVHALLAGGPGALTCSLGGDAHRARADLAEEAEGPDGLTPRAEAVRAAMADAAGDLPLGGFAPGGVSTGHMPGSAHYEGRAIDVFFRPVKKEPTRHGWVLAQWLVAHAADLDVETVIFSDRIWTASRSSSGWRPYVPPQGPTDNPVLRHLDHVHVDVVRGG